MFLNTYCVLTIALGAIFNGHLAKNVLQLETLQPGILFHVDYSTKENGFKWRQMADLVQSQKQPWGGRWRGAEEGGGVGGAVLPGNLQGWRWRNHDAHLRPVSQVPPSLTSSTCWSSAVRTCPPHTICEWAVHTPVVLAPTECSSPDCNTSLIGQAWGPN